MTTFLGRKGRCLIPSYHYKCQACDEEFETTQSIKAEPLVWCDECDSASLERVIHAPMLLIRSEPKTLGHLADKNTANMGHYELEDKREAHRLKAMEGRKHLPQAERPWWRTTEKVDTKLASLAPNVEVKDKKIVKSDPLSERAMDYIMTGKK